MGRRSSSLITEILKEANTYSINRVLPFGLFVVSNLIYWSVMLALFVNNVFFDGKPFTGLGELTTAYLTVQSLIACWLTGNKFTNSKYNTAPGAPGKPMNPMVVDAFDVLADNVTTMSDRINNRNTEDNNNVDRSTRNNVTIRKAAD